MKNKFNLEINKPCSENFNEFVPTPKGGFCGSCEKEVIDFSKMKSEEIIRYFNNKNSQNTCGKFNSNQLKTYTLNPSPIKKLNFWSKIGIACIALLSMNTVQAQTESTNEKNSKSIIKNQEKDILVKGIVSDESGPLPGASITLEGSNLTTKTDFDGVFEFPETLKKGDVLVFSFVGMESKKLIINTSNYTSNVELKVDMQLTSCNILGKIAVKKVYKSKK